MGLDVKFKSEIRGAVLSGIVLCLRCAQQNGGDVGHVRGVLALAEHQSLTFCLDWPGMLDDVRTALGSKGSQLLDAALSINAPALLEVTSCGGSTERILS